MTQVSDKSLAGRWSLIALLVLVGLDVITAFCAFRGASLLFRNTIIEGIAMAAFLCLCPSAARRWKGSLIGPYVKSA